MDKSCKTDDWGCICDTPRTTHEQSVCSVLGAVDTYAAQGPPPKGTPYAFQRVEGKMGPRRSQMFTWTTKVHAPSWSLPAVGTCPSVCDPSKRKASTPRKVPGKCLGCYAFKAGKYGTPGVEQAMHRRWGWFDSRSEDDVVEDMVKAIRVAGREMCKRKKATKTQPWVRSISDKGKITWSREDPVYCEKDSNGTPNYFRIFDSGDFHDARAVRIWQKIANRFKRTKFWAPTTAWIRNDDKELQHELGILARMKNVILKPSGLLLDTAAVKVNIGGTDTYGTTVLNWKRVKGKADCPWEGKRTRAKCDKNLKMLPGAKTLKGDPVVYDPDDDATLPERILVRGEEHYLCRGDCAKCRRCWEKGARVAYVQHGPAVSDKKKALKRARTRDEYLDILYPQSKDIGPEGATHHPATRYLGSRMLLDPLEAERKKRAETAARKEREKRLQEAARRAHEQAVRDVAGYGGMEW